MKKLLITLAALGLTTGIGVGSVMAAATDFMSVDHDKDDKVSLSDVLGAYPGLTQSQFTTLDLDGDGFLNSQEYAAVVDLKIEAPMTDGSAMAAVSAPNFMDVDQDDDDKLTLAETLQVYPGLTQAQFTTADLDGDEFLNDGEFNGLAGVMIAPVETGSVAAEAKMPMFIDLDMDKDDKLSLSEALQAWPDLSQADFQKADLDGDTFLNNTEYDALAAS